MVPFAVQSHLFIALLLPLLWCQIPTSPPKKPITKTLPVPFAWSCPLRALIPPTPPHLWDSWERLTDFSLTDAKSWILAWNSCSPFPVLKSKSFSGSFCAEHVSYKLFAAGTLKIQFNYLTFSCKFLPPLCWTWFMPFCLCFLYDVFLFFFFFGSFSALTEFLSLLLL